MSWIDDIVSLGSSALNYLGGNSIGSALARTAVTGLVLNQVAKSLNKENKVQDKGTRVQVEPNPDNRIPIVYGDAVLGGAITDAVLTNGNGTMFFCFTICERTGNTNLGAGAASEFKFNNIYWNDNRLLFQSDGITASGFVDKANNICTDIAGKIKVYCYAGNSQSPVCPVGYTNTNLANATNIMPGWTSNHSMSNLIFAIVQMDYDAEAGVTSLGTVRFDIENSMSQPGDCLYDYMTNTRYGAGIDPTEIYSS